MQKIMFFWSLKISLLGGLTLKRLSSDEVLMGHGALLHQLNCGHGFSTWIGKDEIEGRSLRLIAFLSGPVFRLCCEQEPDHDSRLVFAVSWL